MRHGVELLVDVREAVLFLLRGPVRGGGVELVLVEARRRGSDAGGICDTEAAAATARRKAAAAEAAAEAAAAKARRTAAAATARRSDIIRQFREGAGAWVQMGSARADADRTAEDPLERRV